jgi:predicted esterase
MANPLSIASLLVAAQLPSGQLQKRVVAATDTSQRYVLYLPPGYSSARTWPILFVLDPRGRAMLAEQLFEDAAARLGWIVMSSYNSLSDGPPEANITAMNALLASAQGLAIDRHRLYLAGFSGTARASLRFATLLRGQVAGVIAVGGALGFGFGGPEMAFAGDSTFAVFGAAGTRDFNYQEVFEMGDRLGVLRVPYRIVDFVGPHSWPPATQCGDALAWLELRAMLGGLRPLDSGFVRTRLTAELARAMELETDGRRAEALRLNSAVALDYARWPEARSALDRVAMLRNDPTVARYDAEAKRVADGEKRQAFELQRILEHERAGPGSSAVGKLTSELHIAGLQKTVARGDSLEASSARRQLARIFVWLAFYEPRTYLANGAPGRALRMFAAAVTIAPIQGEGCPLLRQALAADPSPSSNSSDHERFAGQCTETP